jgi:Carboxypeptidase regulatory-like domain
MRKLLTNLLLLSLIAAFPALARTHAVGHPAGYFSYSGSVVDSISGQPVAGAEVVNEKLVITTDAHGAFTMPILAVGQTMLTIRRAGYESVTVSVQPAIPATPILLKPLPGVVVKTKTGQTIRLDLETVNFVYAQPLGSQISSPSAALCKDGTPIQVDRAQIARISNAVRASGAACCSSETLWFDLELKTGEHSHVALVFDCMTYYCFLGGNEHDTFSRAYIRFEDISEVTFP